MSVPNAGPAAGSVSVEAYDPHNVGTSVNQPSTKPSNSSFITAGSHPLGAEHKTSEGPPSTDPESQHAIVTADEEESDHPVAPDQFDPKYEATKWEIWSYY